MTFDPSIRAEYLFHNLDHWVEEAEDMGYTMDEIATTLAEYLDVVEDLFLSNNR